MTALSEWCERIDQLSQLFQELEFEYGALPLEVHLEHATARVVALVIELTACNESWYYTFALITRWYFEHLGLQVSPKLLEQVISGYFESWTEPSAQLMEAACGDLGKLAQQLTPSRDDLEVWLQTRERAFSLPLPPPPPPPQACDGHRAYILGPESGRDSRRASRMLAALERCRHDSNEQVVLSFQLLSREQSLVLDQPEPALRTTWAYAKGGREALETNRQPCEPRESTLTSAFSIRLATATPGPPDWRWISCSPKRDSGCAFPSPFSACLGVSPMNPALVPWLR